MIESTLTGACYQLLVFWASLYICLQSVSAIIHPLIPTTLLSQAEDFIEQTERLLNGLDEQDRFYLDVYFKSKSLSRQQYPSYDTLLASVKEYVLPNLNGSCHDLVSLW